MALATSLRKVASKLMLKFGGEVTFRRITTGAYNTSTGVATPTAASTTVRGVLEDVNEREVSDLVQATDKRLTVAAFDLSGTAPKTSDEVIISNITYQIIAVKTVEQDNIAITYELTLRA